MACVFDGQSEEGPQRGREKMAQVKTKKRKKGRKRQNCHMKSMAERINRYICNCTSRHRVIDIGAFGTVHRIYVSSIRRRDYNFILINAKCRSQVRASAPQEKKNRIGLAIDVKERWKTACNPRRYIRCSNPFVPT